MGAGVSASSARYTLPEYENLREIYRREMAAVFSQEFAKFKEDGMTTEDFEKQIQDTIARAEPKIISRLNNVQTGVGREPQFVDACKAVTESISSKNALTFLCCVDGSDAADLAFDNVLHMRRKIDCLILFHAFSDAKSRELPPAFRPNDIRNKYEAKLVATLTPSKYSLHWEERGDRSALKSLVDIINSYTDDSHPAFQPSAVRPDFVVMGYAGRKGPKTSPTTLGSTADLALRSLTLPCIIIKKPPNDENRKIIMAVSASTELGQTGLDVLLRLVRPRDQLRLIFVIRSEQNHADVTRVSHYYEEELRKVGPVDSMFVPLTVPVSGGHVKDVLVEYVNEEAPDFFAISPHAKPSLSSMTEYLIQNVKSSIILCKV
jgi:nucleotide-binding universal stress UspA family protein